ncbi:type IV toxin-antitoxin system AbiEi family antitoxin [Terriglobus sp. ADX1]|uniref:type IV toxin-antitoxin system AbiEi family antitoxin n=1 Tax=Terriglobus sp. ADX1 TaxID=2794063 RepID=UPI002FE5254C
MAHPDHHRQQVILNDALEAVKRTAHLDLRIVPGFSPIGDTLLELNGPTAHAQFVAEIKVVRNFATLGMIAKRHAHLPPHTRPLLVAPYITRALAERCRELNLPFIDTAGNAHVAIPGLTVFITGEPRPTTLAENPQYRVYTEVGMKVTFALLCKPELADATYRDLAHAAKVALGTLGPVIKDLEARGHLVQREGRRTLTGARELVEAWVARYPDTLRPKLVRNRYECDVDRLLALEMTKLKAYWGAEVAAARLTGYLRPEHFTLYVRDDPKAVLTEARARLDLNGNTELLQVFWDLPEAEEHPDLVPPLLVYADLMATQDGRNIETARLLYERYLEDL